MMFIRGWGIEELGRFRLEGTNLQLEDELSSEEPMHSTVIAVKNTGVHEACPQGPQPCGMKHRNIY